MIHSPEGIDKHKEKTSCILFQRINAVPYLYFPTFNHGEIQCLLYCVRGKKRQKRHGQMDGGRKCVSDVHGKVDHEGL